LQVETLLDISTACLHALWYRSLIKLELEIISHFNLFSVELEHKDCKDWLLTLPAVSMGCAQVKSPFVEGYPISVCLH